MTPPRDRDDPYQGGSGFDAQLGCIAPMIALVLFAFFGGMAAWYLSVSSKALRLREEAQLAEAMAAKQALLAARAEQQQRQMQRQRQLANQGGTDVRRPDPSTALLLERVVVRLPSIDADTPAALPAVQLTVRNASARSITSARVLWEIKQADGEVVAEGYQTSEWEQPLPVGGTRQWDIEITTVDRSLLAQVKPLIVKAYVLEVGFLVSPANSGSEVNAEIESAAQIAPDQDAAGDPGNFDTETE